MFLFFKYLHGNGIIYRDLKPENILVDKSGYLKFIDFGLSKRIDSITYTVCGTPHYLAPEILMGKGYSYAADLYSFGVVLYEMLIGSPPIDGDNHAELFHNIVHQDVKYPSNLDKKAKKLLKGLLKKNPSKRMTLEDIANCSFFSKFSFNDILNKRLEPPFFPSVKSDDDTSNFKKIKIAMLNSENCPKMAAENDIFLSW
jgi:serine/threonine protein kinase